MTRSRVAVAAVLLVFGVIAIGLSIQSAADATDPKETQKDVKFACSKHGPTMMVLTLSFEPGAARKIEILGENNPNRWKVTIDGGDPLPAGQGGASGDTIKVHPGDEISWKNISTNGAPHAVAFAEQDLAQAMLEFDTTVSKPLVDLNSLGTADPKWKAFGNKLWGVKPVPANQKPFLVGKVKEVE